MPGHVPAWCAAENNPPNQWIQVDFLSQKKIYGVVIQGRSDYDQWVTEYLTS